MKLAVLVVMGVCAVAAADSKSVEGIPPGKSWNCFSFADPSGAVTGCYRSPGMCARSVAAGVQAGGDAKTKCHAAAKAFAFTYRRDGDVAFKAFLGEKQCDVERGDLARSTRVSGVTSCVQVGASEGVAFDAKAVPAGKAWFCAASLTSGGVPLGACERTKAACAKRVDDWKADGAKISRDCQAQATAYGLTMALGTLFYPTESQCVEEQDNLPAPSRCKVVP